MSVSGKRNITWAFEDAEATIILKISILNSFLPYFFWGSIFMSLALDSTAPSSERLFFPDPPTPTRMKWPLCCRMILVILVKC